MKTERGQLDTTGKETVELYDDEMSAEQDGKEDEVGERPLGTTEKSFSARGHFEKPSNGVTVGQMVLKTNERQGERKRRVANKETRCDETRTDRLNGSDVNMLSSSKPGEGDKSGGQLFAVAGKKDKEIWKQR